MVAAGLWIGLVGDDHQHSTQVSDSTQVLESHKLLLQSAGHHSGVSRVQNLYSQGEVRLRRGITLLGLVAQGPAVKLAHVDTCYPSDPIQDSVLSVTNFKALIEETSDRFVSHAVIADDSAVCGDNQALRDVLRGLELDLWQSLKLRQPYIAIMRDGEDPQEFIGSPSRLLSVLSDDPSRETRVVPQRELDSLARVAHAGGGVGGKTYTNSLEALDYNQESFSHFEIDFSWTSDSELVCFHDWEYHFEQVFGIPPEGPPSLERFISLVESRSAYQQCTLDSLTDWLKLHPHARIVTDIKERNIEGLIRIAERYPDLKERFIPQVYQPGEYFSAKYLGFDDVIWTLYRYSGSDSDILAVLNIMDLYGLTMTKSHAHRGLAQRASDARGVLSWVHTVNDVETLREFERLGVDNIYTDWLQ